MDRAEIVELLGDLGARLAKLGLTGEMYVVGGAAIALAYADRRVTRDIDAVFEPKLEIYRVAAAMAVERSLPTGWLNDAVKGFLAGPDPAAVEVLDVPGMRVSVASPRMLLALKVLASRVGEDEDDVRLLAGLLGLQTADEVVDLGTEVFGDRLGIAAQLFVEEAMSPSAPGG